MQVYSLTGFRKAQIVIERSSLDQFTNPLPLVSTIFREQDGSIGVSLLWLGLAQEIGGVFFENASGKSIAEGALLILPEPDDRNARTLIHTAVGRVTDAGDPRKRPLIKVPRSELSKGVRIGLISTDRKFRSSTIDVYVRRAIRESNEADDERVAQEAARLADARSYFKQVVRELSVEASEAGGFKDEGRFMLRQCAKQSNLLKDAKLSDYDLPQPAIARIDRQGDEGRLRVTWLCTSEESPDVFLLDAKGGLLATGRLESETSPASASGKRESTLVRMGTIRLNFRELSSDSRTLNVRPKDLIAGAKVRLRSIRSRRDSQTVDAFVPLDLRSVD